MNGTTNQMIGAVGPGCYERVSPCSTFKIVLSLIGYENGILTDENNPKWLDEQNIEQTPQNWIRDSLIWYSQKLTPQLGLELLEQYVSIFDYGNQDLTGDPGENNGLTESWLNSSLKISPFEQLIFLQKLIDENLPVSNHAFTMTKRLLLIEETKGGWSLYGKTGLGQEKDSSGTDKMTMWFIGWIKNDEGIFIFALYIRESEKIIPKSERIEMAKRFLEEAGVF